MEENDNAIRKTKAPLQKPELSSGMGQRELDRAEAQMNTFTENLKDLSENQFKHHAPTLNTDQQTYLSSNEIKKSIDIHIKPSKSIGCRNKFNEDYRSQYEYMKEYVHIIAEHRELRGQTIELWTKFWPGVAAEYWEVPVNKPIWVPRYVSNRIKECGYHTFAMDETRQTERNGMGTMFGAMIVTNYTQRLDVHEVTDRHSISMKPKGISW